MKILSSTEEFEKIKKREETSGLLYFLSATRKQVATFNDTFEFGIQYLDVPPTAIDNNTRIVSHVGFVIIRLNHLIPETIYCLYCLLKEKVLRGYIGIYRDGQIETLKELKPIKDFKKGQVTLYDWLRQLVRVSCEKSVL